MFIKLNVSIIASVLSLAAGVLVGFFLFSQNDETAEPVKIANEVRRKENKADFSQIFKSDSDRSEHSIKDFELIEQLPELPTGCEITSLTMVLKYLGYDADKMKLARDYLVKQALDRDSYGKLHGPDFRYVFAGNPETEASYGCFAPCIVNTAQKFLYDREAARSPVDLTGTDFEELFSFIDHDIPVIIWSTMGLAKPEYTQSWTTADGEEMNWPTNEHCVVLTAYDINANTVRIHDPVNGIIILNLEAVKERYDELGKNAVVIIDNK